MNITGETTKLQLPVQISYQVINDLLQEKLQGKILSKGKDDGGSTDQARINEILLDRNLKEGFPVSLHLKLKLLTTVFSGREVEIQIHLSPGFNPEEQEVFVENYELDSLNNGWIINNLIEGLVNSFLYKNLKNKMKFNLQKLIQSKMTDLNTKLLSGMEVKNGIFLSGEINRLSVEKISFEEDAMNVVIDLSGNNSIKIQSSAFLN